jgi:hypothetical protein
VLQRGDSILPYFNLSIKIRKKHVYLANTQE